MSKIYQALELEHRKNHRTLKDPVPFENRSQSSSVEKHSIQQTVKWSNHDPEVEEEFINLYYTIHSMLNQKSGKVIQFVGSTDGDGTSTIVEEFGRVSTAELGKSVLLLRTHPDGHTEAYPAEEPIASNLERLSDGASAEEVFSNRGEACFFVWSLAGSSASRTVKSAERFQTLLSKLREHFDLILIDMPSLSNSPLALASCGSVDGVILVLEAEKTNKLVAEKTKKRIERAGGNILGAVLNKHRSHLPSGLPIQL